MFYLLSHVGDAPLPCALSIGGPAYVVVRGGLLLEPPMPRAENGYASDGRSSLKLFGQRTPEDTPDFLASSDEPYHWVSSKELAISRRDSDRGAQFTGILMGNALELRVLLAEHFLALGTTFRFSAAPDEAISDEWYSTFDYGPPQIQPAEPERRNDPTVLAEIQRYIAAGEQSGGARFGLGSRLRGAHLPKRALHQTGWRMTYTTLISTAELAALATLPNVVVVDCRFALDDVEWGQREYLAGHVPGAVYAHVDRDLSGPKLGTNGRHPLPDPDVLLRTITQLGISNDSQVVAYDQDTGMYGSRLWWLLRWMGHDAVAVLDGGFAKWVAEGRPTTAGDERNPRAEFVGVPTNEALVDADAVSMLSSDAAWRLVDARAPERFRGEVEPLDKVAGHIPGAVNYFYQRNIDENGTWLGPEQLRLMLDESVGGVSPDHVVCYCGSGVTACHNVLAFEHAGLRGAKLYAGSWSEWSSDPRRPVAVGESTVTRGASVVLRLH